MANILIIDDDPEIINLLQQALFCYSHLVLSACHGREGLAFLKDNHVDVVITDIIMPEADGFEVLLEIICMKPRPVVIVMTGGSERLNAEDLMNIASLMGVEKVLRKPFDLNEVLDVINSLTVVPYKCVETTSI